MVTSRGDLCRQRYQYQLSQSNRLLVRNFVSSSSLAFNWFMREIIVLISSAIVVDWVLLTFLSSSAVVATFSKASCAISSWFWTTALAPWNPPCFAVAFCRRHNLRCASIKSFWKFTQVLSILTFSFQRSQSAYRWISILCQKGRWATVSSIVVEWKK